MARERILIVESDDDRRRGLREALAGVDDGIVVIEAACLDDAACVARAGGVDCLVIAFSRVSDWGCDAFAPIERLIPGTPRIALSSSEDQRVVIEALRFGFDDFVHMTDALSSGVLLERVRECVDHARRDQTERRQINRRLASLQRAADTDPLTGLWNRRRVDRMLREDVRKSDRREMLSLMLFDLDGFKRVNDTFGHDEGDRVLRRVSEVLREACGPSDVIARWGGDEFVVLRYVSSESEAWSWADRTRRLITRRVRIPRPVVAMTASVGIDVSDPAELCDDALHRADHAMYLAKDAGGDRACTWPMVRAMDAASEASSHAHTSPTMRLRRVIESVLPRLGTAQRMYVSEHGCDVASLSNMVGGALGLCGRTMDDLLLAAEFHDIGKLGISEDVLSKPGAMTSDERRFVDGHARFGSELMRAAEAPERACRGVLRHHDRYDCDQPDGGVRAIRIEHVLCVCDALEAMLRARPYKPARPIERALSVLRIERGKQFHPHVIDAVLAIGGDGIRKVLEMNGGRRIVTADVQPARRGVCSVHSVGADAQRGENHAATQDQERGTGVPVR
ncbi:MAG: hypothetical protein Tsb0013_06450 [Phycisphaerales bacterium]